jgi:microcystin-dependent protein
MGQPYIGEIRMFGGNFAPAGWAFCNGQTLPISENDALFTLIGTMYGGDGAETFNLPDLQGRVPVHFGTGPDGNTYQQGEKAGVETVTLSTQQIPVHNHALVASGTSAQSPQPQSGVLAQAITVQPYITGTGEVALAPASVTPVGGSQPHDNRQPYLCISFIIALFGIFPHQ